LTCMSIVYGLQTGSGAHRSL